MTAPTDTYNSPTGQILYGGKAAPNPAPAWLITANPAIGEYVLIPNSNPSSVTPSVAGTVRNGNTGISSLINAYCGAGYNRATGDYTIGPHGGHLDYAGNQFNGINIFVDAPTWTEWAPPSADQYLLDATEFYLDGRPAATHSYSRTQWVSQLGKCILMPMAGIGGGFPGAPAPPAGWAYMRGSFPASLDLATKTYDPPTTWPEFPGTSNDATACVVAQDFSTGMIYYGRNGGDGFYKLDPFTKTWTKLSLATRVPWYSGTGLDFTRGRMLIVGSFDPLPPVVLDIAGQAVSATFTGPNVADIAINGYPGVVYDEANDCYLVFYDKGSIIDNYRVNAATWYVDKPIRTGAIPAARPAGINNSIHYVPNIGGMSGCVGANSYTGNMFFLRTA